jgi:hypothetical protein
MNKETEIINYNLVNKDYDYTKNKSVKFLTIYEKTSIIGLRKQQLSNGANTYLTDEEAKDVQNIDDIVNLELKYNKIPFMLCRTFSNGIKEYWKLEDLIIL